MANNARFYIQDSLQYGAKIVISESVIRHFFALRIKQGESVTLFNGDGYNYSCLVLRISKKEVELEVQDVSLNNTALPSAIHLMMAMIQKDNFELVIQKAVEMGVNYITPINTDFSQRIDQDRLKDRVSRWQQIAISASEQSGRSLVPVINYPLHISEIIDSIATVSKDSTLINILGDLDSTNNITNIDFTCYNTINIFVGPEGGFSDKELKSFDRIDGICRVSLGVGILRAETAAIVAIGSIMLKVSKL
jgi:16S rRNA (uracil1498-N3)-methyltransferase